MGPDRMPSQLTRFAARSLAGIARYSPIRAWMHGLARQYKEQEKTSAPPLGTEIPEITPLNPRLDTSNQAPRLNLLVPAVSARHVFGGIETALQVFEALCPHIERVRIIVMDEVAPEPRPDSYYGHWPVTQLCEVPPNQSHIVAAGFRWNQTLAVHAQDYFMATAWWTAHNGFALLDWQLRQFPATALRKMLYLVQDYEPGFYPWSSRYALAQATYTHPQNTVAIINSRELADYLVAQGHHLPCSFVLQPRLHPKLANNRNSRVHFVKERTMLVYGRPGTERNAFVLLIAALRLWVQSYPEAAQWNVISAGEDFPPVDLGQGCLLRSVGKLDIEQYADLLARSAVGLSLMISPHPSYPPLEMAAFGVRVLTNNFANKNLSQVSSYIRSVQHPEPASIAAALCLLTTRFDEGAPQSGIVSRQDIDWEGSFISTEGQSWDWIPEAAQAIFGSNVLSTPDAKP